jgi:hypothetical protein
MVGIPQLREAVLRGALGDHTNPRLRRQPFP